MTLTPFQTQIALLLAQNRTPDSHLAGRAALHFKPNTLRYSNDLDNFHDSAERVLSAFDQDEKVLIQNNYTVTLNIKQIGFVRAIVSQAENSTKVERTQDIRRFHF